ncbi:hypothetical protein AC1031_007840 [Aphanomyces cochlioides]|nr:hypothetical protein AC1031_007840 [Aphanomyces cochlioides]
MSRDQPGVVTCLVRPDAIDVQLKLRRSNSSSVVDVWTSLSPLPKPKKNEEKICDIYKAIRPYVPEQWKDDVLYKKPTVSDVEVALKTKLTRAHARSKRLKTVQPNKRNKLVPVGSEDSPAFEIVSTSNVEEDEDTEIFEL